MSETTKRVRRAAALVIVIAASFAGSWLQHAFADRAVGAPPLTYSGTALMGGVPIPDRMHDIGLTLYTRPTTMVGAACDIPPAPIPTTAGRFTIALTDPACGSAIQQGSTLYVALSVDGVSLPRTQIGAVPYAVQAENGVPPGSIMPFASETPPTGWVVCDGRALDGDDPQYGALRAALGTTWGTGTNDADAATDFNIPDLRGRFLRGFDDAMTARDEDRATRVESAPGGRIGSHVGTLEAPATHAPTVPFALTRSGDHAHTLGIARDGSFTPGHLDFAFGGSDTYYLYLGGYGAGATTASGDHTHTIASGGDAETRPENVAVLYIIKL